MSQNQSVNRPSGRRVQVRASVGRTALFSLVVIGLTIGMLTLAGTTPNGIGRPVENPSRVQLDQRTFSCAGGIPDTKIRSGSLRGGLDPVRTVGASPTTIVAGRDVAAGSFAGQQAVSSRALAWVACPEPRARWWFVGAGGAAVTHDTILTLSNPRAGEASVDINVYGPDGLVDAPEFRSIPIPAKGSRVLDLAKTAPAVGNLAVSVIARRGLVAVSAVDRFSPGTLGKSEREWLPPQSLPAKDITLAGIPAAKVSSTLVVVNPNDVDAIVKLQVIGKTGTFTPEGMQEFIVSPHTTSSLSMAKVVDGTPLAVRVSSAQPITATLRSVKDGDPAFATGVGVLRGGTSLAVPDGTGQLVLSSLKTGGSMRVLAFSSSGARLLDKTVKVEAATSVPVALPAGTRYLRLVADDHPDLVAGFVVLGKKGLTSGGVTSAIRSVRLPKVRPAW